MSSPRRADFVEPGGLSLQGPHRVGAFAKCPQLEAFAHELHLRPLFEKLGTGVGKRVHGALAYRYAAALAVKPSWYIYKDGYDCLDQWALHDGRTDLIEVARHVYSEYEAFYPVETWLPIAVEHQFVVTFPNGEVYSCRTDLLAECHEYGGGLYVIDHKCVSKVVSSYGASYATDRQMLTNVAILRANGYPVEGVIINAMSREYPKPTFRRFLVPLNAGAFDQLGADTLYWLDRMKEMRKAYPDPMNRPRTWESCMGKFGACDYTQLCSGRGTLNDFTKG